MGTRGEAAQKVFTLLQTMSFELSALYLQTVNCQSTI